MAGIGNEFQQIAETSASRVDATASEVKRLLKQGELAAAYLAIRALNKTLDLNRSAIRQEQSLTAEMILIDVAMSRWGPKMRSHLMGGFHHFDISTGYSGFWRRMMRHTPGGEGHSIMSMEHVVHHGTKGLSDPKVRAKTLKGMLVHFSWLARPWKDRKNHTDVRSVQAALLKAALNLLAQVLQAAYASTTQKDVFREHVLAAFKLKFCSKVLAKALKETQGLWQEHKALLGALQDIVKSDALDFFAIESEDIPGDSEATQSTGVAQPVTVDPGPKRKRKRKREETNKPSVEGSPSKRLREAELPEPVCAMEPTQRRTRSQTRTHTQAQPMQVVQPLDARRKPREARGGQFTVLGRAAPNAQRPKQDQLSEEEERDAVEMLGNFYRSRQRAQTPFGTGVHQPVPTANWSEPENRRINNEQVHAARLQVLKDADLQDTGDLQTFLDQMQTFAALPRAGRLTLSIPESVDGVLQHLVDTAALCASGGSRHWRNEAQFWTDVAHMLAGPSKAALREGMWVQMCDMSAYMQLPDELLDALSY
ncbi:hypothetical protein [Hydrogenophaga sp.]|uniref:hypothetical protein n=1 Tax=Hydrogenophaga sp. TaxID=1904254 RepID=UPI002728481C|nr:hypothetical protein [Hydrogenophaga sp.]MDO9437356.1 hypothetical protein [Hydrogenophaga sp.]